MTTLVVSGVLIELPWGEISNDELLEGLLLSCSLSAVAVGVPIRVLSPFLWLFIEIDLIRKLRCLTFTNNLGCTGDGVLDAMWLNSRRVWEVLTGIGVAVPSHGSKARLGVEDLVPLREGKRRLVYLLLLLTGSTDLFLGVQWGFGVQGTPAKM